MWQIINKVVWNSICHDYKIGLRNGNKIIYSPQNVLDRFFFVETVDNLLNSTNNHINVLALQQKIDYCPNNIFLYPVTENEVESVTQSSQGNSWQASMKSLNF